MQKNIINNVYYKIISIYCFYRLLQNHNSNLNEQLARRDKNASTRKQGVEMKMLLKMLW